MTKQDGATSSVRLWFAHGSVSNAGSQAPTVPLVKQLTTAVLQL